MKTVESLSIAQNALMSPAKLTTALLHLQHLKYLNVSRQGNIYHEKPPRRNRRERPGSFRSCLANPSFACAVKFPPKLTRLDLSYFGFQLSIIPELALMNNNSLQYVYLSSNAIQMLPKPFYCAPNTQPSFKVIDLSSNKVQCINSSYFAHCN